MQTPWTEGIPRLEVAGRASPGPSATTSASQFDSRPEMQICVPNRSCESGSRFEPARLRRPRLAPRPAPRPRRKTTQYGPNGYAGERGAAPPPEQLPVPAANAPPGFPGRSGISAGPCTPRMCWAQSPLRPRDYRLQKGGTTCTWPAQWFLFSISDPEKRWAQ